MMEKKLETPILHRDSLPRSLLTSSKLGMRGLRFGPEGRGLRV